MQVLIVLLRPIMRSQVGVIVHRLSGSGSVQIDRFVKATKKETGELDSLLFLDDKIALRDIRGRISLLYG